MANNIARFEKNLSYNCLFVTSRVGNEVTVRKYLDTDGRYNYYRCPITVCEFDGRKMEGIRIDNRNYFADLDRNTEQRMIANDSIDRVVEERIKMGETLPKGFDLRDIHKIIRYAYNVEKTMRTLC